MPLLFTFTAVERIAAVDETQQNVELLVLLLIITLLASRHYCPIYI